MVSKHKGMLFSGSLIDYESNRGFLVNDVRVHEKTECTLDVVVIDHHKLLKQPVCSADGVVETNRSNVVVVLHKYAGFQIGLSINLSAQMEDSDLCVDEKFCKFCGSKILTTLDGYVIPLDIKNSLA